MANLRKLDLEKLVVEVMQPTLRRAPFSGDAWLFEPKWDGFRAVCYVQEGKVRLLSRNKRSLTEKFPELQSIAGEVRAVTAILDGEIVAIDAAGIPCFDQLKSRRAGSGFAVVFYAFDLLYVDGRNLMDEPLVDRKKALRKLLPERRGPGRVRYTDHVLSDGKAFFKKLESFGLEGMVAKRVDSRYRSGRTQAWLKIKTVAGQRETERRSTAWHG
jgi:bifunctional non-homologous end joining protein LigD